MYKIVQYLKKKNFCLCLSVGLPLFSDNSYGCLVVGGGGVHSGSYVVVQHCVFTSLARHLLMSKVLSVFCVEF